MNLLIVDDEALARQICKEYSYQWSKEIKIFEAAHSEEADKILEKENIDTMLLDIEMPGKSGLDWLRDKRTDIPVIFTTAYDAFAIKAFEIHAIDYLLKPFSYERFQQAMQRIQMEYSLEKISVFLNSLHVKNQYPERILIKENKSLFYLAIKDIVAIEAMGDYCKLHTVSNYYTELKSLSDCENFLPPNEFIRVHRSCIIHLRFLKRIYFEDNGEIIAEMENNKRFAVSKNGFKKLKQ